eukprot:gene3681-6495_t
MNMKSSTSKRRLSVEIRGKKKLKFQQETKYETQVDIHPQKKLKDKLNRHKIAKIEEFPNKKILTTEKQIKIHLEEDWFKNTPLKEGDIINIIYTTKIEPKNDILINNKNNMIIVNPDILLNTSQVSQSYNCIRKGIFSSMMYKSNKHGLQGTMIHEIFQQTLEEKEEKKETNFDEKFEKISKKNLRTIFECDQTDEEIIENIKKDFKHQFNSLEFFKQPNLINFTNEEGIKSIEIKKILDSEESIWSFQYGLKAKIDHSILISIEKNSNMIIPFELKTGNLDKSGNEKLDHKAQVLLYILLMSERYNQNIDRGILYYFKNSKFFGISRNDLQINSLIQIRNKIVFEMETNFVQSLNSMSHKLSVCKHCFQKSVCMIHHRSVENGTNETSGAKDIFEQETNHLSQKDLQFLKKWLSAIHLESNNKMNEKFHTLTSKEKETDFGDCLSEMKIKSFEVSNSSYIYTFEKKMNLKKSIFQNGDFIVVSSENFDFGIASGTILNIFENLIELILDHPLKVPYKKLDDDLFWRIDKRDLFQNSKFNIINLFLKDIGDEKRRKLIVDLNEPKFKSIDFKDDDFDKNLNKEQIEAIKLSLSAKDYSIILGFPGTGKSYTIANLIKHLFDSGKRILISSHTNPAIDNILSFLERMNLPFVKLKDNNFSNFKSSKDYEEFISKSKIFTCTCYSAPKLSILSKLKFDYCIIDEAGQISIPAILGTISLAEVFILVGDHKQLPPVVKNKEAKELGMNTSLFQFLGRKFKQAVQPLLFQYRMNEDILYLSNNLVYKNKLKCYSNEIKQKKLKLNGKFEPEWLNQISNDYGVLFYSIDSLKDSKEVKMFNGIVNLREIEIIKILISSLLEASINEKQIGIISPFNSQCKNLKDEIQNSNILINTIDKFQGIDRDVIIVSLVKSNDEDDSIGELMKDVRRINVAITRAKKKLIFVGSLKTYEKGLSEFTKLLKKRKCVFQLDEDSMKDDPKFAPNEDVEVNSQLSDFSPKVQSIMNYYIYNQFNSEDDFF